MKLHSFARSIDSSHTLIHIKNAFEAQTVYRNHLPTIQIFQTINDKKQRDKKLRLMSLGKDPENTNVLVKGDKPLTIDGMKGFIEMIENL